VHLGAQAGRKRLYSRKGDEENRLKMVTVEIVKGGVVKASETRQWKRGRRAFSGGGARSVSPAAACAGDSGVQAKGAGW